MKAGISSVINQKSYATHKNQQRKKWALLVVLLVLTLVFCYSFIFETTLKESQQQFSDLSLSTRITLLNQIFNPWGILCCTGLLVWLFIVAEKTVRKSLTREQSHLELIELNDVGQYKTIFGPAFINTGLVNVVILKNYMGFIHVFLPLYPSEKELYFFNNLEKIDQVIRLQTQSEELHIVCRTKEGIPVTFRSVVVTYRFMVEMPDKNHPADPTTMKNDLENVRWNLLRRGQLSSSSIVRIYAEMAIGQVIRKYLLDELDERTSNVSEIQSAAIDKYLQDYRAYKLRSLRKHWYLFQRLNHSANLAYLTQKPFRTKRRQRKQMHGIVKGDQLYSHGMLTAQKNSQVTTSSINQNIHQHLSRELQKYNLELVTLSIPSALPNEKLVSQKIEQSIQKSNNLSQIKKDLQAYQLIQYAKLAFWNTIQASSNNDFTPKLPFRSQEELLLERARRAGIPGIDSGKDSTANTPQSSH